VAELAEAVQAVLDTASVCVATKNKIIK